MASSFYGVSAYQQTNQVWKKGTAKKEAVTSTESKKTEAAQAQDLQELSNIKTTSFKPIDLQSSLVPQVTEAYGYTIGEAELSDKAKDYYNSLKSKFGNAEFVLVSKDMKSQVQANASSYGNANKMVVLIDEEKLERMAEDESYRKKYEGIISMAGQQLAGMKNSLASSGASVKNFGMSVDSNGSTDFFAVMDQTNEAQTQRLEKKAAEKKAEGKKAKKLQEQKRTEKRAEKKAAEQKRAEKREEQKTDQKTDSKDTAKKPDENSATSAVEIHSDSLESLLRNIQNKVFSARTDSIMTEKEKIVGQHFDLKG